MKGPFTALYCSFKFTGIETGNMEEKGIKNYNKTEKILNHQVHQDTQELGDLK